MWSAQAGDAALPPLPSVLTTDARSGPGAAVKSRAGRPCLSLGRIKKKKKKVADRTSFRANKATSRGGPGSSRPQGRRAPPGPPKRRLQVSQPRVPGGAEAPLTSLMML